MLFQQDNKNSCHRIFHFDSVEFNSIVRRTESMRREPARTHRIERPHVVVMQRVGESNEIVPPKGSDALKLALLEHHQDAQVLYIDLLPGSRLAMAFRDSDEPISEVAMRSFGPSNILRKHHATLSRGVDIRNAVTAMLDVATPENPNHRPTAEAVLHWLRQQFGVGVLDFAVWHGVAFFAVAHAAAEERIFNSVQPVTLNNERCFFAHAPKGALSEDELFMFFKNRLVSIEGIHCDCRSQGW